MSRLFDAIERLALAGGALIVKIAVDQLDGLCEPSGGFGLPNLAIASRTDPLDERVSGDRIGSVGRDWRHGATSSRGQDLSQ